jgi:hypothetical protein
LDSVYVLERGSLEDATDAELEMVDFGFFAKIPKSGMGT